MWVVFASRNMVLSYVHAGNGPVIGWLFLRAMPMFVRNTWSVEYETAPFSLLDLFLLLSLSQ